LVIKKPMVKTWIFRNFRHPNYIVVFLEVILVCLFFNDLNSLILFATVNSILLGIRIFYEEKANKFRLKL
jgi:methyltransferase